ncbi:MAG: ABC transporter permease [Proteobacteria bacterium]|nr:ABC transporter permease [Pseudomonadota bacterium]
MLKYLIKRLLATIPVFFGITVISFFIINLTPGSPTDLQTELNPRITPEIVEKLRKHYDLDKPVYVRYIKWVKNIALLDFGNSLSPDGRKVIDKIKERLPVTLLISLLSMIIMLIFSIPLGIYISVNKGKLRERIITFLSFFFYSMPSFWLAVILIIIFGIYLRVLPISGLKSINYAYLSTFDKIIDIAKHLILPLIVATTGSIAYLSRYVSSNLDEVLKQEYILLARIKGLPEKVILRKHALKNALIPVITILGLSVPGLIGGSVIFETIFSIPGMGQLFFQSAMSRDYPVIMALLVLTSILTLVGNILADIGYALSDPRIRYGD